MKKSYDYFKTLKILSEAVSEIYVKTLNNQEHSSKRVFFFAEKSELLNNLRTEFITPLERGDIFLLAECLSEELNSVFILQEYFNLIDKKDYVGLQCYSSFFEAQNSVFSNLKNNKSNLKLFEQCSEEMKKLKAEKKKNEKYIIDAFYCKTEQPLIKYAVYSYVLELNKCIYKTFLEIERILINNS